MTRSFSITGALSSSLTSLVSSYLRRATHAYSLVYSDTIIPPEGIPRTLDIFSAPTPGNTAFLAEISTLFDFAEPSSDSHDNKFASLELTGLYQLAATYGRSSEQYQLAARTLKTILETSTADSSNHIAILSYTPSPMMHKRQAQQSPLHPPHPVAGPPARRLATCLTTVDACSNATSDCFGHGQCVSTINAGRECFVCACSQTTSTSGKTESWVGDMCQKKDISGSVIVYSYFYFVLLT